MPKQKTFYCLGCDKFHVHWLRYFILPKEHFPDLYLKYEFPLCPECKGKIEIIVANAELINGRWKEPIQLEIPMYFLILKNFIMPPKKGED